MGSLHRSAGAVALVLAAALAACSGNIGDANTPIALPSPSATPQPTATPSPSPSPSPTVAPPCTPVDGIGAPVPMRRLTARQVERSVEAVLGVSAPVAVTDERLYTYRSNISASVDAAAARVYLDFAEEVAGRVALGRCRPGCEAWLLDTVAPQLFRRPLAAEQRARYAALYALGEADGGEGARWVIEALLQSPSFLYLDEGTRADGLLDDHAIAARLALVLWGSGPDAALLTRADEGRLSTAEDVRQEIDRLLRDPRSEGGLGDFVEQWLELYRLDEADGRPDLVALGPDTLAALRAEPARLFRAALLDAGAVAELLTTARVPAAEPLRALYGADLLRTEGDTFVLDPARRAGLLSLPGVMAALSHAQSTSPTLRGHAVLANFFCAPPPPPPAGVSVTLPPVSPGVSTRERLEQHFSDDSCASCHRTMDGIGFAFEGFDWLGESRDSERGMPINARSTFRLGAAEVTVDGPVELATWMSTHATVSECVARQWVRYAAGVPETAQATCLIQELGEDARASDGLRNLMFAYLTSDWFRRGPEVAP